MKLRHLKFMVEIHLFRMIDFGIVRNGIALICIVLRQLFAMLFMILRSEEN